MAGLAELVGRHNGDQMLRANDFIHSPKHLYFGRLEPDGRFVVYRGTGPDDKYDELWSTKRPMKSGMELMGLCFMGTPFQDRPVTLKVLAKQPGAGNSESVWATTSFNHAFKELPRAVVLDDGNFCVVLGDGSATPLWASSITDPVVDVDVTDIQYDIKNARTLSDFDWLIDSADLENPSDRDSTFTISRTATNTVTSGWSDSLAIKIGVKTTFKAGIPFVGKGGVEIQVETTNTYTWNGSTTDGQTFSWTAPITVGPWERGHVVVSGKKSKIRVPYTLTGEVTFKSGKKFTKKIDGIYEGTNGHSVKAVTTRESMKPGTTTSLPPTVTDVSITRP
jgi:toxin ETX/toxin MTX2